MKFFFINLHLKVYMLDIIMDVYFELLKNNIKAKVIYVTKPQVLDINNDDALTDSEFNKYFNENIPSVYLYCGYPSTIKSILYDRHMDIDVFGYNDGLSVLGSIENNAISNHVSVIDILNVCFNKLKGKSKVLKRSK